MAWIELGDYLIYRLQQEGVNHVFGVPGDYVLGLFDKLAHSPLQVVNTCDEQGAGFAADAYARLTGLGVAVVTYGVGGLKLVNTTAEAYAEKTPVLVISGAPGIEERAQNPGLHHKVRAYDTQRRVYEQLTVATADLSDPLMAAADIDRVLEAVLHYKQPGYIEVPRDLVGTRVNASPQQPAPAAVPDPQVLNEFLQEATTRIKKAKQPVILVGAEMRRLGLQDKVLEFAEDANIPLAVSILGKSVIPETHSLYLGVYAGELGNQQVRDYVESSDCLLLFGVFLTDVNLGVYTANLDDTNSIYVANDQARIGHHHYLGLSTTRVMNELVQLKFNRSLPADFPGPRRVEAFVLSNPDEKLTVKRLFSYVSNFVDCNTIVVADVGDSLFGATDLITCSEAQFLSPAYYTSLGFAVPASIGAQAARPDLRPLVLVGDGAFQMTGLELSTSARFGLNPIVIVLNNSGYGTERPMQDGAFNDVLSWHYDRLPDLIGAGKGYLVRTEGQLVEAMQAARQNSATFSIINAILDQDDISPALQRLTSGLGKRIR